MALPVWSEVRDALTAAIRDALPLQVREAGGGRIAGLGVHVDAYYGAAGVYLLPESTACSLQPEALVNIGDWPISTDWDGGRDHSRAFAAHWKKWELWFNDHLDDLTEIEGEEKVRWLLRAACEAVQAVEAAGWLGAIPKAEGFKVIIAEHDEPNELAVERYGLFVRSGIIRCHGEDSEPGGAAERGGM